MLACKPHVDDVHVCTASNLYLYARHRIGLSKRAYNNLLTAYSLEHYLI